MTKRNSHDNILIRRRRRAREATSAFRFLISAPHDLSTGPLLMPGQGRLAMSHSAALSAGQVNISAEGGRQWTHRALVADAIALGNWAGENSRVTQVGSPTGTLSLFVQNNLDGTFAKIAQQVVA